MATRPSFTVTAAPVDIVAALNLTDGPYTLQNVGRTPIVFAQRDSAVADVQTLRRDKGHVLAASGGTRRMTVDGDVTYVWTVDGESDLIVSDAIR